MDSKPIIHIFNTHCVKVFLKHFLRLLVNGSATWLAEEIFVISTSLLCMISHIKWNLRSMCFVLLWALSSTTFAIAPLLSQWIVMGDSIEGTTPSSWMNLRIHTTSLVAIYSDSVVESAVVSCLQLLQLIAPFPRVKINLEIDFLSSISDWKSESVYP